ncbi:MAG: hypothetical protein ACXQS8_03940 [Candidatus Helarchaeales archaeon]
MRSSINTRKTRFELPLEKRNGKASYWKIPRCVQECHDPFVRK